MELETSTRGYFEGADFIRIEEAKFREGEFVSYYGVAKIIRIETTKGRKNPKLWFTENRDYPYYHVENIDTGATNQEFNNTLNKDKLANLLYG